jgi:hypothetical protein
MSRLTAEKLRLLLDDENLSESGEDSCDEDEIDVVETRDSDSESEGEDEALKEVESNVENEAEISGKGFRRPTQPPPLESQTSSSLLLSTDQATIETSDFDSIYGTGIIMGRFNSSIKNTPYKWFSKPNNVFERKKEFPASVIPEIANEKEKDNFFKLILSFSIIQEIVNNTNKRISLIDNPKREITINEVYAFIGILILLGITKKLHVPVTELCSESSIHFARFAAVALSRERFQLISRHITFDDLSKYKCNVNLIFIGLISLKGSRQEREGKKLHKMGIIFDLFKKNLLLIILSYKLCVDETLYSFRGFK